MENVLGDRWRLSRILGRRESHLVNGVASASLIHEGDQTTSECWVRAYM